MAEGDRDLASQIFGGDEDGARPTASRTNSSSNAVAGPSNAAASTEQNQIQRKKVKKKKKDKQDGEGKKKKKKKKRKEREESYDSQDEAPDDGDLNAEEFIVDAILHAIYKPFAANRNLGGCAWHYICLWHGYPPSQTSDEDPITHDMFSPGSVYVEEFWKYSRGPFERQFPTIARSSTARKGKHPSEPLAKMGDSWECPPHLLNKWYREARYAYRKDLRIASAKVIERPKSLKWADRKKNMIKWIRWTNMKIAETAQDSQSHGLRLLSANEDGDGDSSSSEYEGSSDDEETSEEEALIKKAKVDGRKRDRRVDSSPSKSDGGRKRRLESSPSKSEDERKKKQKKDQDRGKGKDQEGERSRDPTVTPRAWSPGLYTAGASPESKKKEEKRQKMEKLKRQRERRERREEAERKRKEDEASDVIEIPSTAGSFIEIPSTGGTGAAAGPSTATSVMGTAGAGGSKARKVVVSDSDSEEDVPLIVQQPAISLQLPVAESVNTGAPTNAASIAANPLPNPKPSSSTVDTATKPPVTHTEPALVARRQQPLFEEEEDDTPVEARTKFAPIWARGPTQTTAPAQGHHTQTQSQLQAQKSILSSESTSAESPAQPQPRTRSPPPVLPRPQTLDPPPFIPRPPTVQPPHTQPQIQPPDASLRASGTSIPASSTISVPVKVSTISQSSTATTKAPGTLSRSVAAVSPPHMPAPVRLEAPRQPQAIPVAAPAEFATPGADASAAIVNQPPAITAAPAASLSRHAPLSLPPGPVIHPSRASLVFQSVLSPASLSSTAIAARAPAVPMASGSISSINRTAAVIDSHREPRNSGTATGSSKHLGGSRDSRPTISVLQSSSMRGFKLPCQIDIRLPGMTQRTELFVSDLAVQPLYTGVTPSALFAEPRSMKRLVITRLMAADVIQDLLLNRAVIAHAKVQIVEGPQYAHGNRMMGDFLRELGEEGLRGGLASAMSTTNIMAVFHSTGSPFATAIKTPPDLLESHGLMIAFIAFDPANHGTPSSEVLDTFKVMERALSADLIHPDIVLGSLGFTTPFFERLRGRKVAVVAKEFSPAVERGLRSAGAELISADRNPSAILVDKNGLQLLQHRRGFRSLIERGCECWMYGATVPPLSSDCWLPTRVLEPRGGRVLIEPGWLLADPDRAIDLAKRIRSCSGWSAYVTVQTVFLLGRIKNPQSRSHWDLKFAAAEAMSIVHFVDVLFPLPRQGQTAERLEGMQEWSTKRTMNERLQVANRFSHIGCASGVAKELAEWTSPGQTEVLRVEKLAEQDLMRRRNQPVPDDFVRLVAIGTDGSSHIFGLPILDLAGIDALLNLKS